MSERDDLLEIFDSALAAADPARAVKSVLRVDGDRLECAGTSYDLGSFERIVVVGAGKATGPMAASVEEVLGERIAEGLIIVKYGHTGQLRIIRQVEASHPLPDESGLRGTAEIIRLLEGAHERTLVVCLLSGGASALLTSPVPPVTLDDLKAVTDRLLKAGADIFELNAVRKHLSRVKGGKLAWLASPATLLTLIISDVIGDRLDTIASGPTVPDGTTYGDALAVIGKYGLSGGLPESVIELLRQGAVGKVPETPKPGEPFFEKTNNVIAASLSMAIEAAAGKARALGYETRVLTSALTGEAADAARMLAAEAKAALKALAPGSRPVCLVSGGETVVRVTGSGRGGRNQELALVFASGISGTPGVTLLSAGTDGTDGPTDAAGAVVDGSTAGAALKLGLDPSEFLKENDSYGFFEKLDAGSGPGSHLKTGPTGTNVMDLQIMAIRR